MDPRLIRQCEFINSINIDRDVHLIIKNNEIIRSWPSLWETKPSPASLKSYYAELSKAILSFLEKNLAQLNLRQQHRVYKKLFALKNKLTKEDQDALAFRINQLGDRIVHNLVAKNQRYVNRDQLEQKKRVEIRGKNCWVPNENSRVNSFKFFDDTLKSNSKEMPELGISMGVSVCNGLEYFDGGDMFYLPRDFSQERTILLNGVLSTRQNEDLPYGLLGIFDGHRGAAASHFVNQNIHTVLRAALAKNSNNDYTDYEIYLSLKECFENLGEQCQEEDQGTTAMVAFIIKEKIWIACVGDARAILVNKDGSITQGSEDARLTNPRYRKKIAQLKGKLVVDQGFDCCQFAALHKHYTRHHHCPARMIGHKGTPGIVSTPKITCFSMKDYQNGYLVLCSNGIVSSLSSEAIGNGVYTMGQKRMSPEEMISCEDMAKYIALEALDAGGRNDVGAVNNIAAMVIQL